MEIPIIDFKHYSLDIEEKDIHLNDQSKLLQLKDIGHELCQAFKDVGFVYIKNHGLNQNKINEVNENFEKFSNLPENIKSKFKRTDNGHGWLGMNTESLNYARPQDLKESYSYDHEFAKMLPDPDVYIPKMKFSMSEVFDLGQLLSKRILHVMGIGLELEDPYFFVKHHNILTESNLTSLRVIHYPSTKRYIKDIKPGQIRCGEHSDWGSITLLCQDDAGGLEVMSNKGNFIPVPPIPGTIVVNIGDLMERWTGGVFKSTVHRVVLPPNSSTRPRNSLAFFCIPDDKCEISRMKQNEKVFAKSDDYNTPINTKDYMLMKMHSAVSGVPC